MTSRVATAAALLMGAHAADAQGLLHLNTGNGEVAAEMRADRRGYSNGAAMHERSYREWLRLSLQGALPSRQLLSYTIVVRPVFGQQLGTGLPRSFETRSTGIDATASMLQSRLGGLNLFSTRQQGTAEGGAGGASVYNTSARGATVRLAMPLMPVTLDVSERRTADTWRGAFDAIPFERSERMRTARFLASNPKTTIHVERMGFRDLIGVTSFDATTFTGQHRLQWGKGSTLESLVETSDRGGYDSWRRRAWSERLQLQHTPTLSTNWRIQRRSSMTLGLPSSGHAMGAGLQHQVNRSLSVALQADRSGARYESGETHSWSTGPRVALRRSLGRDGWLQSSVGATAETVRRSQTSGEVAEAVEERMRIDPSRSVQLERVNIDITSIVVRSADQSLTYRTPEDYRVVRLGSVTRLQFPVGGRIGPDALVVVAYRYLVLQRAPYRVSSATAEVGVGLPLVHVRQHLSVRQVHALNGAALALPEQGIDDATSIGGSHRIPGGSLEVELERRRRTRSIADYSVQEARILFLPSPHPRWTSSIGANLTRTSAASRRIGVVSTGAALGFTPTANLRVQSSIDSWTWRLSDAPPERFVGASVRVYWKWGQLDGEVHAAHQERHQLLRGVERRVWTRIVRHF